MDLSTRIASWRRALGLRQAALARRVGVTASAFSLWESGKNPPTQQHLEKLVETLGLTMAQFYSRVRKPRGKSRTA